MLRKIRVEDAHDIQALVNSFASQKLMMHLSLNTIYQRLFEFIVYEVDGKIAGVCALHPSWEGVAEIRSLAVAKEFWGKNIGKALLEAQVERAREHGFYKVFALTYQDDFFKKHGFQLSKLENFPSKMWSDCMKCHKYPDCDEIAVEITL